MTAPLREVLGHVLEGEPALAGEVDEVFRRADVLGRRRTRLLLAAGATIAAIVVLAGYLLTTTLLPARGAAEGRPLAPPARPSAVPAPSALAPSALAPSALAPSALAPSGPVPSANGDPVLALIAPIVVGDHLQIVPRPPAHGFGWRQYSVLTAGKQPRGTVQVAVFARPGGLCFPKRDGHDGCARTDRAGGIDYLRYGDGTDPDWQVNEAIARRASDGRTLALMATGERDENDPPAAVPPLSGREIERLATDPRLLDAFGPEERCDGPSADACPVLKVPVPDSDQPSR
jgi:subtilisin family serine protease